MDPLFAVLSYANVTPTQLAYLANVTSDLQTQLDNTASAITGAASTITTSNLTASRALVSDASGKVAASAVPSANLEYVANLTSDAQSQLNTKAALSGSTFTGDVAVQGNLTVTGTTTTINTQQLTVADPVTVLNSGSLNQPSGVYIHQASGPNVAVLVQNSAVEFLSTTADANATSFSGNFMPLRAGNVFASSVTLGNSTLGETANIFQLQKSGANVLMANAFATTMEGNVSVAGTLAVVPTGNTTGCMTTTGAYDSAGNTHYIVPSDIDTVDGGEGSIAGQLAVYVSNFEQATNKTGYAITSILKSPAEFELVPLFVHKNVNLTTFQLGIFENKVRVNTDSDCSVSWKFDGSTVRAPPVAIVAVGSGTASLAYSRDGLAWVGQNSVFEEAFGVACYGTTWLAAGGYDPNVLAYSTDGITWTGTGAGLFSYGMCAASNGTLWIAGGGGSNTMAYSTDLTTWTALDPFGGLLRVCNGVAWNGSMWVAVGRGNNSIVYSSDGITWTGATGKTVFGTAGTAVATNGVRWVAVGTKAVSGPNTIAYSDDGINWTGVGATVLQSGGFGVAWNGTMWVAVGAGAYPVAYSSDGVAWTGVSMTVMGSLYGVTWTGAGWIAVGEDGTDTIAHSEDGITWTGIAGSTLFTIGNGVAATYKPPLLS